MSLKQKILIGVAAALSLPVSLSVVFNVPYLTTSLGLSATAFYIWWYTHYFGNQTETTEVETPTFWESQLVSFAFKLVIMLAVLALIFAFPNITQLGGGE